MTPPTLARLGAGSLILALSACGTESPLTAAHGGRTLYVEPGEGGEWDDPAAMAAAPTFTTIQDAIDAASSGDTVEVPSGSYVEDITMADGVAVVGAGQTETYLYGTVTFSSHSTAPSLSSLTIFDYTYATTGTAYTETGISVNGGNAVIEDVGAYYFNVAIDVVNAADVDIDDVKLGGNWYGIVDEGTSDLLVSNSFIYSNPAGGIATSDNSNGTTGWIVNNTFYGNGYGGSTAYLTGAVSMGNGGSEVVANNIMTSNYYGLNCYSCSSSWSYNLVWGNTTDYVNDASSVSTDLSQDPLFNDTSSGDYSLSSTSPCIDAGSSTYAAAEDKDGETRPQGSGVDIGFDEYTTSSYDLVISEVMANASTESTGEFIEIYNAGSTSVDLAGLIVTDGDDIDTIEAYSGGSTTLAAGEYAVIVDSEYNSDYSIDSSVTVVTTGDTNLGNGLTTADDITLYESDGTTIIATFSFPKDPGDGVSMEMYDLDTGDTSGNWRASVCTDGSSPGEEHCFPESGDPQDLIITEVMANAATESTGEYIEVYNTSEGDIDLAGLVITDGGGYSDTLAAFSSFSTLLGPGEHGLILDDGYTFDYYLPTDIVVVSAGTTIGNGLSTSDDVYLYESDGSTLIDSFTSPSDPGDGVSIEKIDYTAGDSSSNWAAASDYTDRGRSPGLLNGAAGGIGVQLNITEVMANADDEDTGEYIEIFNSSGETVDLAGLVISDGDESDTLQAYDGGSTELGSGEYAVILDAEYAGEYTIDSSVVLMTTTDTTLGNSLSVKDEITLYDADGEHLIDAFLWPTNPGNAVSMERLSNNSAWDDEDNWEACTDAAGGTPGAVNSGSSSGSSTSSYDIIITEVMANADTESTGEYVELYNNGSTTVDLWNWVLYDGDAVDTIQGYSSVYDTELDPGEYAVILDADYAGEYSIPSDALLLVTDDSTIGSGLAVNDEVYLYESGASALVSSYTFPEDPGNGISREMITIGDGDVETNWQDSTCSAGHSPGDDNC